MSRESDGTSGPDRFMSTVFSSVKVRHCQSKMNKKVLDKPLQENFLASFFQDM